jgi:hypothetical protein
MNEVAKTRQPTIVPFAGREVISTHQFNCELVAQMIIEKGVNEWVAISEIAKFAYGKAFLANNKRIRAHIWRLRRHLILKGYLLLAEGRPAEHLKIYAGGELERQNALPLLFKMRKRTDISVELYEKAVILVEGCPPDAP